MAEHADGSIIVDTEIDSSGFKSGSAELRSAIKSLTNKVQGLGPAFQKAMSGNTKAMGTFEAKASALQTKIADLEAKMARLGHARLPPADYKYFSLELEKAQKQLAQLEAREAKMAATGVSQKSNAYKSLQYDITLAKEKILDLQATMAGMRQNGTAFQMGSATPEYQSMAAALKVAKQQLAEMDAATTSVKVNASTLPTIGQRVAAAFAKAGSIIKSSVVSGLKLAASAARMLMSNTLKAVMGMTKLGKSSRRTGTSFATMLKSMLFFTAFSAVLKSLKQGIDALAKSSSSFNATMSELKTSTAKLRNAFITAFAPILSVVVPILSTLISKLATAINVIGQFFAALTGARTYTKAITQQQDYAASLDKTAGAAKEAKRQLAGFDELNVLSDTSGGGGGGAAEDPGVQFEEVPIENGIAGFADKIKEAFTEGDFAEIGRIVGEGLNTVVGHIYNFMTGIDWEGMGVAFSEGLNGFVQAVDWDLLGKTIGTYFRAKLEVIHGAVTTFDWKAAGNALGTAVMSMWKSIPWEKAGETLSTSVTGVLNTISSTIKTMEWQRIGNDVASFVASIKWTKMVKALADGIGSALGGLASLLWGFVEDAWGAMVDWWYDTAYEDGQFTIEGLLKGIGNALKGIGKWIVDNIFTPFINGFKAAFKIGSPSKVMQEQGGYLISGLRLGISNAWSSITSFFNSVLPSLKSTLSNAWNSIKSTASTANQNIRSTVSSAWSSIQSTVSSKLNSVKSTASSAMSSIKSTISSAMSTAYSTVNSKMSSIKSSMTTTFSNLKSNASTWGRHICENIANGISNSLYKVSNAAKKIASKIKSFLGFSEPEAGPLSNFHTYMPDMVDLMVKGMKENQDRAGAAAAGIAQAISDEVQNGDYGTAEIVPTAELNTTMADFTDKIADSFSELMSRLQAIANGVTFTAPEVVTGVAPYSVATAVNSSKSRDDADSSTNDDISSVVIQSVNNATSAIVKAIQEYSQTNVNIDSDSLTDSIISEINRRTRMTGKSPLLT